MALSVYSHLRVKRERAAVSARLAARPLQYSRQLVGFFAYYPIVITGRHRPQRDQSNRGHLLRRKLAGVPPAKAEACRISHFRFGKRLANLSRLSEGAVPLGHVHPELANLLVTALCGVVSAGNAPHSI